ncbi:MAG TPA: outer membrane lipid asymmetry maintenance protein MlaD [Steroidobacteraceae bacterium]|nr:outer membrane lipid asymmetry maintenance protein MlaD [Steroidobacteraceae bacterium]
MTQTRATEIGTGLFALLGFAALFFLVTQITNRSIAWNEQSYRLTARFDNVGGLKVGAPVSMGGVTIGRVEAIDFDSADYKAVARLKIQQRFAKIPNDSDVAIFTAGLLGGQYVGITPGGSETYFRDGDQIELTQSAVVLENLISKFLFDKAGQEGAKKSEGVAK